MKNQGFIKALLQSSKKYGIKIDRGVASHFFIYYRELFMWNKKINLISGREERRFIERHIIDSLFVLKKLNIRKDDRFLDLGSGNGLPGITLAKMLPENTVDLLESNVKKCVFLKHIKALIGLKNTKILCERFEKIHKKLIKYNYVLVRGKRISEKEKKMIMKILKNHGSLIIYTGEKPLITLLNSEEEMECYKTIGGRKIIKISRF